MAEKTKIEWADATFNPWRGCQKVSPGCTNCYAEAMTLRFNRGGWGPGVERTAQSEKYWQQPAKWERAAKKAGERRRVFCGSMIDVFDNAAPLGARDRLWKEIRESGSLDWLLLTKRPENIAKMLPDDWVMFPNGYPNVWLGISAEDQERYDHRWPILARIPAVVRFISYEPALCPVGVMNGSGKYPDWVICGGESGPGARPMSLDWARWIRNECDDLGIPFFFKQWGRYVNNPLQGYTESEVRAIDPPSNGKGGALLDGRLWREFPLATAAGTLEEQALPNLVQLQHAIP